jgi:hypothetical protein
VQLSIGKRIPWFVPSVATALAACSSGALNSDSSKSERQALQTASSPAAVSLRPPLSTLADAGVSTLGSTDPSAYAVAVGVSAGASCAIAPAGGASDALHTNILSADSSGVIRFFPPSPDWGSRLLLQCTLNGVQQADQIVDLNDSTTFQRLSMADIAPKFLRTRAGLSSDPSLSASDLAQQGYPPRPDPTMAPERYAAWLKHISKPTDLYQPVDVAALGLTFGLGQFKGANLGDIWDSIIQAGSGFDSNLNPNYGTRYDEYYVDTFIPVNDGCLSGANCVTGVWAGIGGRLTDFLGGGVGNGLIQNGFAMAAGPSTTIFPSGIWFFHQFADLANNNVPLFTGAPPGKVGASLDEVGLWGWSADSSSCALGATGKFGCFAFEDYTNTWGYGTAAVAAASDWQWVPSTVEYATECPPDVATGARFSNLDYIYEEMLGEGWDTSGNTHLDPGNASGNGDPYIQTWTTNQITLATWAANGNDPATPAGDPILFEWQGW